MEVIKNNIKIQLTNVEKDTLLAAGKIITDFTNMITHEEICEEFYKVFDDISLTNIEAIEEINQGIVDLLETVKKFN